MGSGKRRAGRGDRRTPWERGKIVQSEHEARLAQDLENHRRAAAIGVELVEIEKERPD